MERPSVKSKSYELTPLGPDSSSLDEPLGKRDGTWLEYAFKKLSAMLWIVVAAALTWYIKLPDVIVNSYKPDNTDRQLAIFWFNVGLAGFASWCLMALYLVIWLKYVKQIEVEWEEYSPRAIPIATVCAVASLLGCGPAVVPALHQATQHPWLLHSIPATLALCGSTGSLAAPLSAGPRPPQLHRVFLARLGPIHAADYLVPLPGRAESGAFRAVVTAGEQN